MEIANDSGESNRADKNWEMYSQLKIQKKKGRWGVNK